MKSIPAILPLTCAIAFKEWEGICAALASGRQSLILRKGGIDEGPGGFTPEHPAFWLYPTKVHQAEQGLKVEETGSTGLADTPEGVVPIELLAIVKGIGRVEQPEALAALDPFHCWTQATVEKRFFYRQPGLWVLGVRVYRLPDPLRIEVTSDQLGCKTWVPLVQSISTQEAIAVLDDDRFDAELAAIRLALSPLAGS